MNDAARDNGYKYNGKELNEDWGLGWYDYGARYYDAALGRFTGVDPIADRFPHVNEFNYAENKVPNAIDLWGLQAFEINQDNKTINISANIFYNKSKSIGRLLNDPSYEGGKTLLDLASEQLPNSIFTIDNRQWTVSFNVQFKGVDSDQAIADIIAADPNGLSIGLVNTTDGKNFYSNEAKTMVINSERGDGTTIAHEFGHSLGLPHSAMIEGSPYFGKSDSEETIANTSGLPQGPLMSYDSQRKLHSYEIGYLANHALKIANGQNITLTNYYSSEFKSTYGLMPVSQYQQLLIYRTAQIQNAFKSLNIRN